MAQMLEIEQLVRELNSSRNQSSPDIIDAIQKRIQRLQREREAWQWGIDMLNHDEAVMRFYGALTLTIKINADWDTDKVGEDRNLVNHLLESLVSSYVRLASIPDAPFVLQKLCTTLVAVFQKPQSAWALPIRHLTACTIANRYIPQESAPELSVSLGSDNAISGAQLRSLLTFPMTLAEQDVAISGMVKERQSIRIRVSNNISDVLRLLNFTATTLNQAGFGTASTTPYLYSLSVKHDAHQFLDVAKTMLQLIPLWTADIKIKGPHKESTLAETKFDLFQATIRNLPYLYQQEALASTVLQSLTTLEESSHQLLQNALPGYEEHIVRSEQATAWIEQLISGDFDPDAVAYMNFLEACMSQVDVTTPEYLETGCYIEILRQVQKLLQCDGAPGVDDTVCQVALEILTSVTEGFGDWPGSCSYDESMKDLVRAACASSLSKIRIPAEQLDVRTRTWDADDRAKFQDFRYDVQDYMQNAFSILGDSLIEEITKTVIEAKAITEWNLFEAGLFSFLAFSDTLANEPERFDKYIGAVFSCEQWRTATSTEVGCPDPVRQMVIKVIGENTGFLQRHTDFLVTCLNFLFTSLQMESTSTAASRAIWTLCDAQRSMLTEALPQFMSSLSNTSAIEPDAKHRIYGAVGAIIEALPSEVDKIQPLTQILQQLIQQEIESEVNPASSRNDLIAKAIDVLQTIASLGRGLRISSDAPIDLEKTENSASNFWISGPGLTVQQQALYVHSTLLERTGGSNDPFFVEAACGFLKTGFTEQHPSPFKFSNDKILELLSIYMRPACPQPDLIMSTASGYLASVKPADADNHFDTLVLMSVRGVNETLASHKAQGNPVDSDFCTAALDFFTRLLPKWARSLLHMSEGKDVIGLVVEVALILLEDADTLPRRSAALFFTALFDASAQSDVISDQGISLTASEILQNCAPRILASITRLLGGICARSDIDTLAETIKKAVQKLPLMTGKLLKEAVKDENAVLTPRALQATTPEQRARFVSQIEMLRGSRKTNEIIRNFWIACKGRDFEYVT